MCVGQASATVIVSEDFEGGTVGLTVDTLPGWSSLGDGGQQVIGSEGSNQFATTSDINNAASRYDLAIANPGFNSSTKLIMTIDVYDPTTNPAGSSTFPRAYGGVGVSSGGFIPPVFCINQNNDDDDFDVAEVYATGEDFAPTEHFGPTNVLAQDTWYTMRAIYDLGSMTMDVYAKTRDGVDPFALVLSGVSTPFTDGNQDLTALNVWRHRLNRGTRIDNIVVEAVPEPASVGLVLAGLAIVGGMKLARRRVWL
jgi:hypothetical protein